MDARDPARIARQRSLIRISAIGLYASVALVAFLAWLTSKGTAIPEVAWLTVGGMITLFGNLLMTAFNFEFGSSAGSQAKDARLPAAQNPEIPK